MERVEASAAAQRQLLERGLQLTAHALASTQQSETAGGPPDSIGAGGGGGGNTTAATSEDEERLWRWRADRLRLLQHLERLDTALALANG